MRRHDPERGLMRRGFLVDKFLSGALSFEFLWSSIGHQGVCHDDFRQYFVDEALVS
jgi:hypothetical protein